VARRALAIDPRSDQIELSLLRLYKATGAHAAAAEQYAHYASVVREDLGIEPPSLESL
jgi:DNA-binding SARP family transcriptional activator